MVLDVAITPEMQSLRRLGSLMQRDLARNFARVAVLKSPLGTTFYTFASDVHDAWLALSMLRTQLPTRVRHASLTPRCRNMFDHATRSALPIRPSYPLTESTTSARAREMNVCGVNRQTARHPRNGLHAGRPSGLTSSAHP